MHANRREGKKDEPQMNQPSSGSRRTMAGRLQIYAHRDGNLNSREKAQKTQKKTKKNSRKAAKTQRGPRMRANRRELKKIHAKGGRGVAQAKKTQNLHRRSQRSRSTGEKTFSLLTFPVPVCVSGRQLQLAPRSPASGPRGGGGHRGRGE